MWLWVNSPWHLAVRTKLADVDWLSSPKHGMTVWQLVLLHPQDPEFSPPIAYHQSRQLTMPGSTAHGPRTWTNFYLVSKLGGTGEQGNWGIGGNRWRGALASRLDQLERLPKTVSRLLYSANSQSVRCPQDYSISLLSLDSVCKCAQYSCCIHIGSKPKQRHGHKFKGSE